MNWLMLVARPIIVSYVKGLVAKAATKAIVKKVKAYFAKKKAK